MTPPQPLEDVTVVDLGQIYNAPYATLLMALAGANVIKIEPLSGESLRSRGRVAGAGSPFAMLNSNKQAVTLNLKDPRGIQILKDMVSKADVVVENFRPGIMEKLGVGSAYLRELNPRLVYAAGSGYGSTGPYRDYPAMDITIQAMSGIMSVTGYPDQPPVKAGPAVADFLGGIHLYGAIMTALYQRGVTGEGTTVEVAMLDAVYPSLMSSLGLFFGGTGEIPSRTGNRHSGLAEAPYNVYPASDGYVSLICVSDAHWKALTEAIGRPELADDERYTTRVSRVERIDDVDGFVTEWTQGRTRDTIMDEFRHAGVPAAPVREISEVVNDPHLRQRGMLREIDHPEFGQLVVPHSPLHIGDHNLDLRPSPSLGQDNKAVFGDWLGVSSDELVTLKSDGVI